MDMSNNPFNYGMPVSPKHFVGRWKQVETMVKDLTNPGGLSHALIGGRRFGKSSFLETLQYMLIQQLAQSQVGDLYPFPVLVSLKYLAHGSPGGVFALMLRTLYDYFHSPLRKRDLGIKLNLDLTRTRLAAFVQSDEQECSLDKFSGIVEELLLIFMNDYGSLRPIFLLDETEKILEQEWTEVFFGQVRSLIYTSKLRDYIRCVLAGSSKIIEVREKGSPLLNMLKIVHLEALDDASILEIVRRADNVPEDLSRDVLLQCGGHPFLTQYIMHYVWDSMQAEVPAVPLISNITNRFRSERSGDLKQWEIDIGKEGLIAYKVLVEADTWLTEVQVKQRIEDKQIVSKIGRALVRLCYHGLVVQDGTWSKYRVTGQLFKGWFSDEILPDLRSYSASSIPSPPSTFLDCEPVISIYPLTKIFPTAYSHAVTAKRFPFVQCTIDNTCECCANARVTIEVSIPGFGEPYTDTLDIPSGQSEQTVLLPRLHREKVLSLTEIYGATCRVLVRRHIESGSRVIYDKTYDFQLQAFDTALLAILDAQGGLTADLTDYLAVFVTPNKQEVQHFIGVAAQEHPNKAIVGYQGAALDTIGEVDRDEARSISRKQAKAFFSALKKHAKLHYINSPVNLGKQPYHVTQRVRFSFQSLPQSAGEIGQANCIDGAILFASLLENAGMEPLIVLVPGHAFVGWRIWKSINEYDFLETTMIKTSSFETALAEGNRQYHEAIQRSDHLRTFLDARGFLCMVDITACRTRGIYALT